MIGYEQSPDYGRHDRYWTPRNRGGMAALLAWLLGPLVLVSAFAAYLPFFR